MIQFSDNFYWRIKKTAWQTVFAAWTVTYSPLNKYLTASTHNNPTYAYTQKQEVIIIKCLHLFNSIPFYVDSAKSYPKTSQSAWTNHNLNLLDYPNN